jgi:hypothetical protein
MEITRKLIVALVKRNENSKTPVIIYPHEVPVLQVMFGEEGVEVTDTDPGIAPGTFDTADEYSRLEQYYKGSSEIANPTREAFRNLKEFEAGFEDEDGGEEGLKDELIARAKELGIPGVTKNWGIPKLEAAIAEKTGE